MPTSVWLIDDCPLATKLTKARLVSLGVEVQTFVSGGAAIAAWVKGGYASPCAMLFDLHMPGPTGLEAGRILRDAGYMGALLLHTTTVENREPDVLASFGFDGTVVKPATKDELQRLVVDACGAMRRRSA